MSNAKAQMPNAGQMPKSKDNSTAISRSTVLILNPTLAFQLPGLALFGGLAIAVTFVNHRGYGKVVKKRRLLNRLPAKSQDTGRPQRPIPALT
jgi:hypothetical protein